MTGASARLTAAVEAYFAELGRIPASGGATGERSSYAPLANLLNAVGATLKPKVFCVGELADQGAGHPDFGLYTARQLRASTGARRSGICACRCSRRCSSNLQRPAGCNRWASWKCWTGPPPRSTGWTAKPSSPASTGAGAPSRTRRPASRDGVAAHPAPRLASWERGRPARNGPQAHNRSSGRDARVRRDTPLPGTPRAESGSNVKMTAPPRIPMKRTSP